VERKKETSHMLSNMDKTPTEGNFCNERKTNCSHTLQNTTRNTWGMLIKESEKQTTIS
jgi:hypothetical protein